MPIPTLTGMGPMPEFNDVVNKVNALVKELTNLMLNLDDANFDKITANVMDVQQLSAISADLGTITAGFIYGTYIATRNASYPRAEMNNTNNLFAAMATANQYLNVGAFGGANVPYIEFRDLTAVLSAIINLGSFFKIESQQRMDVVSVSGDVNISSGGNTNLQSTTRTNFSTLQDTGASNTSLTTKLNAKANGSGINGTVYVATTSGGSPTTAITFVNGVRTS